MAIVRSCAKAGHVVRGSRRNLTEITTCPECGGPLGPLQDEADLAAVPATTDHTDTENTEPIPSPANATYALVGEGGFRLSLARPGGIIGRSQANCRDLLGDSTTVSRHQFSFTYREDGGLNIVNLGQFGTVVNRRRLDRSEATVVQVGQTIEFGGLAFVVQAE
jgi:hypothetical protein